jgi:cephalosporin hydroxylase
MSISKVFGSLRRRTGGDPSPVGSLPDSSDPPLSQLDDPFRMRLMSMYAGEPQLGIDGQMHSLDGSTKIQPREGMWMYEICLAQKPHNIVEVGMAYGFSTIYFLAAIAKNGMGKHTAIDPFQRRAPGVWAGIGLQHAQSLCPADFRFIEETSFSGLVRLAQEGLTAEIIFLDGRHLFDYVIADFMLAAEICPIGGHIIFHDLWLSSVACAVAYIRANRADFVPVEMPIETIAAFRRVDEDEREMPHFVNFN